MITDELLRALPVLFIAAFIAILFIQSGLDKIFDWKGNIGWLTGHFAETPFRSFVPLLLGVLTVQEIVSGLLSAAGIIYFLATGSLVIIFAASVLSAATICALFLGQRMAKDYPGAAVLVPYFLLVLAMMWLSMPVKV